MDPSGGDRVGVDTNATWPAFLGRRDQLTAGFVSIVCLCIMALSWTLDQWIYGRSIDIERPLPRPSVELKIDINRADWPELTLLPDISETMARRIIDYRDRCGSFQSLEEIQRVQGIGPRTFDLIEPYLCSIPPVNATAERTD